MTSAIDNSTHQRKKFKSEVFVSLNLVQCKGLNPRIFMNKGKVISLKVCLQIITILIYLSFELFHFSMAPFRNDYCPSSKRRITG